MGTSRPDTWEDYNENPAKGIVIALLLSLPIWACIGLVTYLIIR